MHIAREFGTAAGVGGVKDVTWGLSRATADLGIRTHMFLPYYRKVDSFLKKESLQIHTCHSFVLDMNYGSHIRKEAVEILSCEFQKNLWLYLIKARPFRYLAEEPTRKIERHGIYQYTSAEAEALGNPSLEGSGYSDAFAQNVLMVKATLRTLGKIAWRPDVVHCHDGHAALFPLIAQTSSEGFAAYLAHVPTLITIHNAGKGYHQETDSLEYAQAICGIQAEHAQEICKACTLDGLFDPLLAAGLFGTAINTVSENYARELCTTGLDATSGWLGHALAGLGITLLGITNGIDVDSYHPEKNCQLGLPRPFPNDAGNWAGKEQCKQVILDGFDVFPLSEDVRKFGSLSYEKDIPLFTFVGRLTAQKGFDALCGVFKKLLDEGTKIQLLGLGTGDMSIIKKYEELAGHYPGSVCFINGFSGKFANRVYAAGDFFLIPSRFEPCGLTDFIAQIMGNIPIVHQVGGLVKTLDNNFGYAYLGGEEELLDTIKRAIKDYREPGKKRLRKIQKNALKNIQENFTWEKVLEKKYLPLYEKIIEEVKPALPY
ncbi:MAG: glycogen synthase [Nitrospiria bacterium]